MNEVKFDDRAVQASLSKLGSALSESLARSMGVAGGQVMRDLAKSYAPMGEPPFNPSSRGAQSTGALKNSIYLAFKQNLSNKDHVTYGVSWNSKEAWWGKLLEFSWIQTHLFRRGKDGLFYTDMSRPLDRPIYHAAQPFMRPAFDAGLAPAKIAMIARGKERLPELLRETKA